MNVALKERNVYEEFDVESDVLYFKLGMQGLVSFHGRNYNRKKRITAEELKNLISKQNFLQISSSCYINTAKVTSVGSGTVYFGPEYSDAKQLPVNRRKQQEIQQLMSKRQ
ncbi:LytTR family transcriptional regulator DNA-binding domain-containing protein [Paenibacillus pinisoli]|nr:LytTR family transcriptional regulator DNA-binding domain-containing protein [Paenibacillus pinisoli]